jgi:hypothetical protein
MRLSATKLGSIANSRSFGDQLFDLAGQVPNLDLNFAGTKTLDPRITFTRASTGTFVGSDGTLRTAVTNLLLRSEEFGASWIPSNITISPDAIVAPNGTLTADKAIATTTNSVHQLFQITSGTSGVTYTVSFYVKAGEYNRFTFGPGNTAVGGDRVATINLSLSNPVVSQDAIFNSSAFATPVGNGWYRVGATFTATATGTMTVAVLQTIINNAGSASFAGDGTSGIYLWGAQLEQASTVGDYVPTTSVINSAPRFDHNPTTGESLGLLVEEARTNSIRNNTMVGAVAGTPGTNPNLWAYVTTQSNGLAVSVVGTGVENGINYIDYRFNGTTVASPLGVAFGIDAATAATGQTWTNSLYWKLAAGTTTGVSVWQIGVIENTSGGAFVSGANYVQTAPTTASLITQRPLATRTLSGGATVGQVVHTVSFTVTGNTTMDFTLRLGMPQMEQGAFATSVIPTTSATATRAADVASITGTAFSSFYNQTEGSFFCSTFAPKGNVVFGTADTFDNTQYVTVAASNNIFIRSGGSDQALLSAAVSSSANTNIAFGYALNSFAAVSNGGTISTDTAGNVPAAQIRLKLGTSPWDAGASNSLNGTIKRLTYWPVRLANPTLQSITSP